MASPKVRHLHFSYWGATVADPEDIVRIIETPDGQERGEGEHVPRIYWIGWRAKLLRSLVSFLLGPPVTWDVTRRK